jgi:ABC-type phosphate transport system substrate-binding protein
MMRLCLPLRGLVLVLLGFAGLAVQAAEPAFAVIADPGVASHRLARESVARIFLRKQTYWENGLRIQPVNLPPVHPLRRLFSQSVLGSLPEGLEEYWRNMYFHGVLPPHVLASEEAVVLFVSSTPGAVGYVSTCIPTRGVQVLALVGDLPNCAR